MVRGVYDEFFRHNKMLSHENNNIKFLLTCQTCFDGIWVGFSARAYLFGAK
jgi:hypothetical protein